MSGQRTRFTTTIQVGRWMEGVKPIRCCYHIGQPHKSLKERNKMIFSPNHIFKTMRTFLFKLIFLICSLVGAQTTDKPTKVLCTATTKAATPCTKPATMQDGKCRVHSAHTARCTGTTKAGKTCTRPAGKGSGLCWQHAEPKK